MKVSIITITYNSAATLQKTLDSVFMQDYPNIEYIIIDGVSKDNTLEILEANKTKISKIVSEPDKGLYDALNKGIALATGDIIGLIHSDDFYINPSDISDVIKTFEQTKADALYADLYYVDQVDTDKIIRKWKSGIYTHGSFLNGWMPPHPTFFVKKEIYTKHGNFNLELKSAADYELMLRFIHKAKINLAYLPKYIIKMRVGGMSNANLKNRVRANNEDRKAWDLNDLKPRWYTLYIKPLRKIFQYL